MNMATASAALVAALVALTVAYVPTVAYAAASDAEVQALQMPAWLTRGGKRVPLEIGAPLRTGDTITTGNGSRVVLRLAEGSTVKLGENARFELVEMMQERDHNRDTFKGTLAVRQGAFRFTTAP